MDESATEFAQWFADNHARLYRRAYLLVGNAADAKDLVGDAAEKLTRYRATVNEPFAYAVKVMVSQCVKRTRRHRIAVFGELTAAHDQARHDPDVPTAVTVFTAMREVTPLQRAVLMYRYWDDLTVAATAATLSRSVSTVKDAEAGAIAKLRTVLGADPRLILVDTAAAETSPPRTPALDARRRQA